MKKISFFVMFFGIFLTSHAQKNSHMTYDDLQKLETVPIDADSFTAVTLSRDSSKIVFDKTKAMSEQQGKSLAEFLLTKNRSPKLKLSTAHPNYIFVSEGVIIIFYDQGEFSKTFIPTKHIVCEFPCQIYQSL